MISFESLRTPKPMDITIVWEGQDLHVTYDRAAWTIDVIENRWSMPIRERLTRVLLSWDLLKDGQPWQPLPKDDEAWEKAVHASRLHQALEGRDADNPLSDSERGELAQRPITFAEREREYQAAWNAILLQLPRPFVRAVDTGVLDDFLGVSWRGAISANGSAVTGASGGSTGGTNI